MLKKSIFAIILSVCLIGLSGNAIAQNNLKNKLFDDYSNILDNLRQKNGEVLSPEFFKKAVEKYSEAEHEYDKDKTGSLKDIREKLDESKKYAERAMQIVELANLYLKSTIEAREAALSASAPLYAPKIWEDAESEMHDAGLNLEDDDINDAREKGVKAQQLYKDAELKAIKSGILGDARKAIEEAEDADAQKYAYHTLMDAKSMLLDAEKMIETNPYDKASALAKAKVAAYQGRHARYLAKTIRELSKNTGNWESLILKFEDILTTIATPLGLDPKFDEGFDQSRKIILAEIARILEANKHLSDSNENLQSELNAVKQIDSTKTQELEKQKILNQKIQAVRDLFNQQEAKIVYEGNNLIIRLYGLNFPSGQAVIQPEYFSLLTKVQKAIKEFPDKYIIIEGHTDAIGSPETNKYLSEKRAEAVKEYLLANMDLDPQQITHYGLGDQKPIASNRTIDGRAMNRRIDVIISLAEDK
jgi:OOP family OmpA-OmpF porin